MGFQSWWKKHLNRSSLKLNSIQRNKTQPRVHFTTKKLRSSVKSTHALRAHPTHRCHTTTHGTKSRLQHRQQLRQLERAALPFATWLLHTRYFMMVSWYRPWYQVTSRGNILKGDAIGHKQFAHPASPPSHCRHPEHDTGKADATSPWHKVCRTTSVSPSLSF